MITYDSRFMSDPILYILYPMLYHTVPDPILYLTLPVVNELPPELPQNISIGGFLLSVDDGGGNILDADTRAMLPPIPGVIIIPNNIGFLHQYFSALLMVTNGAPGQSSLEVNDLKATIIQATVILPEAYSS